jgi:hypothetical protein
MRWTKTLPERFADKVGEADANGCLPWLATKDQNGYGRFFTGRRNETGNRVDEPAHRISYLLSGGEIPDGYVIDHLCRNPACVNPAHLEPVTRRENAMRGDHPNVIAHLQRTCRRGHDLSLHGRIAPSTGRYRCRLCNTIMQRERRNRVQSAR